MDGNNRESAADPGLDLHGETRGPWQKPTLNVIPVSATAGGSGSTCETTSVSNASQSS